eukprot:3285522-Pyramimonas_sp.AAC.1
MFYRFPPFLSYRVPGVHFFPPLLHPSAAAVSCHTGVPTVPGVHLPSSRLFHRVYPTRLRLPPIPLSAGAQTA